VGATHAELKGQAMDYVRLGATGLKVSRLCLGTMTYGSPAWRPWVLDEAESRPFIRRALEHGINFFDTADMYSKGVSEEVVGKALKEMAPRHEIVLATKVFYPVTDHANGKGLSRKHIFEAIDGSLRRLGTDFVDLYQIHRFDAETPIAETIEALHDVVKAGKARYIGASSMYAWQFATMVHMQDRHGLTRFVSMQNHYNLVYREEEREMIPFCRANGIGLVPWSPLARGFLAGNRTRGRKDATRREQHDDYGHGLYYTDADYEVADRVIQVAAAKGVLPIQVALAWVLRQPGITAPIIGASKLEQLDQLVAGLSITLTDAEASSLAAPYQPHPVLGH
jgi:aryl-alcohol dehydrogenase-like predicted oxidoreductase